MFPPLRSCSRVLTPFQLLENQTPPLEFWTVIPTVSSDPGLPLSSIDSCTVWLPTQAPPWSYGKPFAPSGTN